MNEEYYSDDLGAADVPDSIPEEPGPVRVPRFIPQEPGPVVPPKPISQGPGPIVIPINPFPQGPGPVRPPQRIQINDAIIEEVFFQQGFGYVTVTYMDYDGRQRRRRLQLLLGRNTRVEDQFGQPLPKRELEEGMVIDAIVTGIRYDGRPPQANALLIRIVRRAQETSITNGIILQVNPRQQFILVMKRNNPQDTIQFNVTPYTLIRGERGLQLRLQDLMPGDRVRVVHATFMTFSLPPQTTAYEIKVLNN